MLTHKYLTSILHYDPSTGFFYRKETRGSSTVGSIAGFTDAWGYTKIGIDYKYYMAHRLAWFIVYGVWPPSQIDHLNRIKTDNRIINLRLACARQNTQNRIVRNDSSSGHKGIWYNKRKNRWRAYISIDGKRTIIGEFANLDDAISTREAAEKKYFMDFAPQN